MTLSVGNRIPLPGKVRIRISIYAASYP